jgi:hypothetical protein
MLVFLLPKIINQVLFFIKQVFSFFQKFLVSIFIDVLFPTHEENSFPEFMHVDKP